MREVLIQETRNFHWTVPASRWCSCRDGRSTEVRTPFGTRSRQPLSAVHTYHQYGRGNIRERSVDAALPRQRQVCGNDAVPSYTAAVEIRVHLKLAIWLV